MRRLNSKPFICVLLTAFLLLAASPARPQGSDPIQGPSSGMMLFDFVLMRPLGIAATILGGATFIVSLPFSALAGNTSEAGEKLFMEPFAFTFERPLGHMEYPGIAP